MQESNLLPRIVYILQLLLYSAIASAIIKYIMPRWSLLGGLVLDSAANADVINVTALYLITLPVLLLAFILWLKR
ncbi:hypothetical protein H6F44_00185 [Pseudanabaena sp. FACHB-1277]|jgi:hypothetical protein|uniref:Uncharacterized protein n=1 Tax=Pseudanabaena cinerea FACHB-1277 TaxID=2949581 RepID=A0A926UQP7_9CYAN|nr:hypothetical protein [Pseudanabaena cinerea]MBD2148557.1 hypothetical protein [Pseudanabaena cinerea FACHB-1277]